MSRIAVHFGAGNIGRGFRAGADMLADLVADLDALGHD
jgi:mannitol-1-phosphate/altronate dehydrogenase